MSIAKLWSYSKLEKKFCIMLTDASKRELQRLIDGKPSRLSTQIKEIIDGTG